MAGDAEVTLNIGRDEVVKIPWSLVDDTGSPVLPDAIEVHLKARGGGETTGTLTNNLDGTGTWTVDGSILTESMYDWHFQVTVGTEERWPARMTGTLRFLEYRR